MKPKCPFILTTKNGYKAEITNPEENHYHFNVLIPHDDLPFDYYSEDHPKSKKAKGGGFAKTTMAAEELRITFQATYQI